MYTLWLQNCSTYKIKCLTLTIPYLINVSLTNISCTRQPSFKVTLYWEKTDTLFWSSFLLPTMIQSLNRKKCRLQHFLITDCSLAAQNSEYVVINDAKSCRLQIEKNFAPQRFQETTWQLVRLLNVYKRWCCLSLICFFPPPCWYRLKGWVSG